MKKITVIILFILIQFFLSEIYGSDENIKSNGFKNFLYGSEKNREWAIVGSEKMVELIGRDHLKFWMEQKPFDDKFKDILIDSLNEGIRHELNWLKNCMGGYYSDKIKDKQKNGKIELRFDKDLLSKDGYHDDEFNENITLSERDLLD